MDAFEGAATPLTPQGLAACLARTGTTAADIWAVLAVETSGTGFLPDRRPKILFERHVFHHLTHGAYDRSHPSISAPLAGGYGPGGAAQYTRLAQAVALNRHAALQSTSWGIGQIIGTNFALCGTPTVEAMAAAMVDSEDRQLAAMADYLHATGLAARLARHDWAGFAEGYNGPDYARRNYDGLLRQFHARYTAGPLPDLTVRAAQIALAASGYNPCGTDGMQGAATQAAIRRYQADHHLASTGQIDTALRAALHC